jgi:hypothetical protein
LKAANRGHKDIRLRERGTKKVHMFAGERKQVKKGAPAWMPDKIWKPIVKKIGIEKLVPPIAIRIDLIEDIGQQLRSLQRDVVLHILLKPERLDSFYPCHLYYSRMHMFS